MKFFLRFLFILLALTISTNSYSKNTCEKLFENKTQLQRAAGYLIKDAPANKSPTRYWAKPFQALEENILDKPVHFASQKILGQKKELGLLLKIPLIAMLSMSAWQNIDQHIFWPMAEQTVTEQILNNTEKNSAYFDKLIANDFRFKEIKEIETKSTAHDVRYNGKNLDEYIDSPKVNARFLAYGLKHSYEEYFKIYSQTKNPQRLTLEENIKLFGSNPLFEHLNFFFEKGVQQFEGTYVAPQYLGPLSDPQKKELFDLTHLLYAKYLIIDVLFNEKTDIPKLLATNSLARDVYTSNYSQKLIALYRQGKISKEKLIYYMQEDAQHAYYMSLFEILHIVNLKSENRIYTSEPLTLEDLRESRLSNL